MEIHPTHIYFSEQDRAYILQEIDSKLARGYISQGEGVVAFERAFAEYTGVRHAVALSSGSAAIEIAMRLQNVVGKTVLVPANTNFATAVGPLRAGADIRLVDVDPSTLSPGVADLEATWTPDTVGIIVVHMGGIISSDITRIREWCDARRLWLFEDCAHAHGSRLHGLHAGRFGFAGGFSFFATKVITSGEGGMLITDDEGLAEEVRLHRNLGKPALWENYHVRMGTNARMSEINALVGRVQLSHLDEFVAWREQVAAQYTQLLAKTPALCPILPLGRNSWYKYTVLLPQNANRDRLKEAMREQGVHLGGEIYERPLHQQPVLAQRFAGQFFPKAEDVCARHICLPIFYGMSPEQVEYVVHTLVDLL